MTAALSPCRLVLVLRLGRSRLGGRLLAVTVLGAARLLSRVRALAAIHLSVAVGVGAAVGVLAVALMLALAAILGLAVLGMGAVAVMLGMAALVAAMALMLGVVGLALLSGSGGLGSGRSDESEGRRGGDENGLHGSDLLNRSFGRSKAPAVVRRVAEAADRRPG